MALELRLLGADDHAGSIAAVARARAVDELRAAERWARPVRRADRAVAGSVPRIDSTKPR